MEYYALRSFIGEVVVNDGNKKKTETRKFQLGNKVPGGEPNKVNNALRESSGLIGSKVDCEKVLKSIEARNALRRTEKMAGRKRPVKSAE